MVTWIELGKDGEPVLCCGAKNAGAVLASEVWSSERKHLLTSGTMSVGEDFGFFKRENGLEKLPRRMISEWSVEAPFDYAAHARLYIPTDKQGFKQRMNCLNPCYLLKMSLFLSAVQKTTVRCYCQLDFLCKKIRVLADKSISPERRPGACTQLRPD